MKRNGYLHSFPIIDAFNSWSIQKYLEDPMAETIIKSALVEGDTMMVDFNKEKEEITVSIKKKKALSKSKEKKELPEGKKELPEGKKKLPGGDGEDKA